MSALHELSLVELAAALRAGEITPREATEHYLERAVARVDLGAFAELRGDLAVARADVLARAPQQGSLWGVPHADKDLVARAGVATRYGSRARADFVPEASDPLARALDDAGVVTLGKTATSEFGLSGYTEPAGAPAARDPWNPANGAGGSSGGAAVAVAAGLLPAAIGSDGGGSIRIPAATVGVVGLKPSRGRLPIGSGLDSPDGLAVTGPLARTVADAALLLDVLTGLAPYRYATRAPHAGPFLEAARSTRGLRIGVTTTSPWDDDEDIRVAPEARDAVRFAADVLAGEHAVSDAAWHPHGYAALFRTLWRASAARIPLSARDLDLVEPLTAWLVREGRTLDAPRVLEALASARVFERETIAAFDAFDAVLTPALAQTPRPVGWYDGHDPERTFALQVEYAPFSSFVNVAGLPALTVPVTQGSGGHPVSVQLIGRPGGEAAIIALAAELEAARGPLPHPPGW
ncbi:amidase [uncultured Microbacterium sp.]|uniref:amidase n=1 Tax=uncultured Microbacterium sp. TaxID=191216 RepID=UPI0025D4A4C3|nr:amidase [uncultured Microbacterium sp.]